MSFNATAAVLTNVAQGVLGFATGLLLARGLGPARRGEFAFVANTVLLLVMVAPLGLATAVVRARAKFGRSTDEIYFSVAVLCVVFASAAALLFGGAFVVFRHSVFGGVRTSVAVWVLVLLYPLLLLTQWNGVLYVDNKIAELGIVVSCGSAVYLAAIAGLVATGQLSPVTALLSWSVTSVFPVAWVATRWRFRRGADPAGTTRQMGRFALRANIANLASVLVWRGDVILVKWLRGYGELGQYTVAVSAAEILLQIAVGLRIAMTPLQGSPDDRELLVALIARVTRLVLAGGMVLAAVVMLAGQRLIVAVYGPRFTPAGLALVCLAPGVVLLAITGPMADYLVVEGRVRAVAFATLAGFALDFTLDVLLLHDHTFVAAAVASAVAYLLILVVVVTVFVRTTGCRLHSLLIPNRSDLEAIRAVVRRARSFVQPSRGGASDR